MTTHPSKHTRTAGNASLSLDPIMVDRHMAAALMALSEPTIERLVREGAFPAPRKLSGNRVAWLLSELQTWCEERPVSDLLPPKNAGRRRRVSRETPAVPPAS